MRINLNKANNFYTIILKSSILLVMLFCDFMSVHSQIFQGNGAEIYISEGTIVTDNFTKTNIVGSSISTVKDTIVNELNLKYSEKKNKKKYSLKSDIKKKKISTESSKRKEKIDITGFYKQSSEDRFFFFSTLKSTSVAVVTSLNIKFIASFFIILFYVTFNFKIKHSIFVWCENILCFYLSTVKIRPPPIF